MRSALIIGAGPAGLAAAMELCKMTNAKITVIDANETVGGMARTLSHGGSLIDIGGHRFFSSYDWPVREWLRLLPLANSADAEPGFLVKKRASSILYDGKYYGYPLRPSISTLRQLGPTKIMRITADCLKPPTAANNGETSLEDFFINRFGMELYRTFFKDYTEKLWGYPCGRIGADWGYERIGDVSLKKMAAGLFNRAGRKRTDRVEAVAAKPEGDIFYYPQRGPGQLWQAAAKELTSCGVDILTHCRAVGVRTENRQIVELSASDSRTGDIISFHPDVVFSSMPLSELVAITSGPVPAEVKSAAAALRYRDHVQVCVLCGPSPRRDEQWIYINEKQARCGRVQFFNNWSPSLSRDRGRGWYGVEYLTGCRDYISAASDEELVNLALRELENTGLIKRTATSDAVVIRQPKAYPVHLCGENPLPPIKRWLDEVENLHSIGRNGLHQYINMDHAMMTGKAAVEAALGATSPDAVWQRGNQ